MSNKLNIGETLQTIRKAKGIQQQELAKMVGISQKHLSEFENGHKEPRYGMLCKLLDALEASILITAQLPYSKSERGVENVNIPIKLKIAKEETFEGVALEGCPFMYCDADPFCKGKCRYNKN